MKHLIELIGLFLNVLTQKDELMKIKDLRNWLIRADTGFYSILCWRAEATVREDLIGINNMFFRLSVTSLLLALVMKLCFFDKLYFLLIFVFFITATIGLSLTWGVNPVKETKEFVGNLLKTYILGASVILYSHIESLQIFFQQVVFKNNLENSFLLSKISLYLIIIFVGVISIVLIMLFWLIMNSLIITFFLFFIYSTIIVSRFLLKIYLNVKINKAYLILIALLFSLFKIIYEAF